MRWSSLMLVASVATLTLALAPAATPRTDAAPKPMLAVVVVGSGSVVSAPAGISCPGKCKATFAAGARVVLTARPRSGARLLRWGGSCRGAGACRVTVSALTAVAAQFEARTPAPRGPAAEPGSYSGQNGQNGNGFSLYVAPGGRTVLNITDPLTALSCTPSGGRSDHLRILTATIRSNGSFTVKAAQDGILDGSNAKFTYTVTGRFRAASAGRPASAAGTWREDVVLGGTGRRCTSNEQSWSVTRNPGPRPQKPLVAPGTYSGSNGQNGNGFSFSVAPGGKSVLNVTNPLTALGCAPSGGRSDRLRILNAPIRPNGSFTVKTTQDGVVGGQNAKFTYTVTGYFMGPTPAGPATVAGIWREDIDVVGGAKCTSNEQSWTVTRTS